MATPEQIKNTAEYYGLTEEQVRDIIEKTEIVGLKKTNNRTLNREQRRKLEHKAGKSGRAAIGETAEAIKKMYYVNLIQKLQELNEKRRKENEGTTEND